MRRWRRWQVPENPEPPSGIILEYRGLAISCTPLRDPDMDRRGEVAWIAVPDQQIDLRPGEEFRLTVPPDGLPDNSVLYPGFAIPGIDAHDAA